MPGGFPLGLDVCNGTDIGTSLATTGGTSVPANNTTANSMGAFTQLIASTGIDTCYVGFSVYNNSTSGTLGTQAVNIAVGAAASEKVIVQNLIVDQSFSNRTYSTWVFPINIPQGTRISAQSQSTTTSSSCLVMAWLFDGAFSHQEGHAGVDSIGFVAANTQGSTITASSSTNTKGSYTQLIASTTRDYTSIYVYFDSLDANATNASFMTDIAIGAGGSEKVVIPNILSRVGSPTIAFFPCLTGPWPIQIPAGTRVAARTQCTTASGKMGVTLYGVYD
jgi:hypothetical protein